MEVSRLKGIHESHQVSFLFVSQRHIETLIVEVDHVQQGRSRAVMEVRRACGQTAHAWEFELADIDAFAGNQSASRITYRHSRTIVALKRSTWTQTLRWPTFL
jgi:hypothetical protein